MPQHIQILETIARHQKHPRAPVTWTAAGRLFTGRGAPMRALAARAACRLSQILDSVRRDR